MTEAKDMEMPNKPYPVQVVDYSEETKSFVLRTENIEKIFCSEEVKNKRVAIISIAGIFRQGKSFLLNFFLRYMERAVKEKVADWLGPDDGTLDGFHWIHGDKRDTTGIWMWSEPFLVTLDSGQEVAVILMDTQGTFDNQTTTEQNATIFALSTVLSTTQVYNLTGNIEEDKLQYLHIFTEFGRLTREETSEKATRRKSADDLSPFPFQRLIILVRDWNYPYNYNFGIEGGQAKLDSVLRVEPGSEDTELQTVRTHIRSCFSQVDCFLMSPPGKAVAMSPFFKGQLKDIDEDFVANLRELVPFVMAPDKLVLKEVNGIPVTCQQVPQMFQKFMEIVKAGKVPTPRNIFDVTVEFNNLQAVDAAKTLYISRMEELLHSGYINPELLQMEHERLQEEALEAFASTVTYGGYNEKYAGILLESILDLYGRYQEHNEARNSWALLKTPIILVALVLAEIFTNSIAGFIGLNPIVTSLMLLRFTLILCLTVWAVCAVKGTHKEIKEVIDTFTLFIWNLTMRKIQSLIVRQQLAPSLASGFQSRAANQTLVSPFSHESASQSGPSLESHHRRRRLSDPSRPVNTPASTPEVRKRKITYAHPPRAFSAMQ